MREVEQSITGGLVDRLGIIVLAVDANGRVVEFNRTAAALPGLATDSPGGVPLEELVFHADGQVGVGSFARFLDGGRQHAVIRLSVGQGRSMAVLFGEPVALQGGTGEELRVLSGVPISDQQALRLDAEVSAKLGVLGSLAHHVVHELNQPLSVIRMATGTTRRKLAMGQADSRYLDDKLARIDEQCLKAAEIVEYMRVYVPRDHKSRVLHDIRRCVSNAIALITPRYRKRNVTLHAELGDVALPLEANEMQLEPIFLGVLDFVEKRISEGAGGSVEVVAANVGEVAQIRFEDMSGALEAEAIEKLFVRSDMPGASALGMGLSLSRDLARESGGDLEISNAPMGLRFVVTLPLSEPQTEE